MIDQSAPARSVLDDWQVGAALMKQKQESKDYWEQYYSNVRIGGIPSQFATFILNEFNGHDRFIDIGCGNGRDSFFFANHGKKVLAADGSQLAISSCQEIAAAAGLGDLLFEHVDFEQEDSCSAFLNRNAPVWAGAIVYARFFLHAIDEDEEQRFLQLSKGLIATGGSLCLEFRTDRDELQRKVTASHYRRFVSPVAFISILHRHGLKVDYFCEGFGLAKYRNDDAHVARFVVSSS